VKVGVMRPNNRVKPSAGGARSCQGAAPLDEQTIEYFQKLSQESGIPYQTLINLYLRECAASRKKLSMAWKSVA